MARWSDRYRLANPQAVAVRSVSSVRVAGNPEGAIEAACLATERAAIVSDAEHGDATA